MVRKNRRDSRSGRQCRRVGKFSALSGAGCPIWRGCLHGGLRPHACFGGRARGVGGVVHRAARRPDGRPLRPRRVLVPDQRVQAVEVPGRAGGSGAFFRGLLLHGGGSVVLRLFLEDAHLPGGFCHGGGDGADFFQFHGHVRRRERPVVGQRAALDRQRGHPSEPGDYLPGHQQGHRNVFALVHAVAASDFPGAAGAHFVHRHAGSFLSGPQHRTGAGVYVESRQGAGGGAGPEQRGLEDGFHGLGLPGGSHG